MPTQNITVVGILNCTPDSFSDGDPRASSATYLERARQLIDDGAQMLDVGGDSTRPGSECCGPDEEWRRVAPVLKGVAHKIPCSVDTHHVEVARCALLEGAQCINDISGEMHPEMLALVAQSKALYVAMFNPHGGAHLFGDGVSHEKLMQRLRLWVERVDGEFHRAGGEPSKLVFDTGMGAFLSKQADVSWYLMRHYGEIHWPRGGAMFGCSRKGFLKRKDEESPVERDRITAMCGVLVASKLSTDVPLYLRVHNPAQQLEALERWRSE
jgi:dihydropteroate synthase